MNLSNTLIHTFIPNPKVCRRATAFTHRWLSVYSIGLLISQMLLGISYYSGPSVVTEDPSSMSKNIITLTNDQRTSNELDPLTENEALSQAAKAKLEDMFKNNYWDHFSPAGKKPWDFITASDYSYVYAGENLAKGFINSGSTVDAWMHSQSHKNNLLSSRYKEIGVAVGSGQIDGKPTTLVVQMFGAPQESTVIAQAPNNDEAVVLGVKQGNLFNFNMMSATIPAKIPYFLVWFILFILIVFDGAMLRRCGLHASKRHLFEFRSALLINGLALLFMGLNIVAVA